MAEEFKMPPMGQTSSTLTILEWRKKEGDAVKQGDVLAEVETDKATLDVESYLAGTLLKIVRTAGETVDVGEVIAVIGKPGESLPTAPAADARKASAPAPSGSRAAAPVAAGAATRPAMSGAASARRFSATAGARPPGPGKVLASPVARKIARDRGIDIATVTGTGPGGRITRDDVLSVAGGAGTGAARVAAGPAAANRSVVARRVAQSFQSIPHVYLTTQVDMGVAAALLERARAGSTTKVTYTHLIIRAVGRALQQNPAINAVWHDSGVPRAIPAANVGLVVAGGRQLAIVVIGEPGNQEIGDVAAQVNAAASRARAGALSGADVVPCAVSVSNLGMYAVDSFDAIIDPDQSAMISVGRIEERVVAINKAMAIRPMMSVTLAADHRVVDGVEMAKFLDDIKKALEGA